MDKETMFEYIQRLKLAVITLFKWLFCSVVCGCFIGSVGAVFHLMLGYVGSLRVEYPTIEAANSYTAPSWFIDDVTNDPAYHNSNMSRKVF